MITIVSLVKHLSHSYKTFFLVLRTFKSYSYQLSDEWYSINYSHHAKHYTPMTNLFYNWSLYLLIPFICFAHPYPHATTNLFSVSISSKRMNILIMLWKFFSHFFQSLVQIPTTLVTMSPRGTSFFRSSVFNWKEMLKEPDLQNGL